MNVSKRQLVRIACDIRDQLLILKACRQRQVQEKLSIVADQLQRLGSIQRKLNICEARAWHAAADEVAASVNAVLRDLPYHMQEVERTVGAREANVPSLREIYQELIQADEEFGELRYHSEGNLLAVTTEAIELDGVYLGDFEVQMHIPSLAQTQRHAIHRIVALDPHPAASNEAVTHPHVSDEALCPGDAGAAIQAALAGGRICDFFLLVRSVLTHYNPDSPYVSLDKWHGTPCYDCGYTMAGDDVYWCHGCEQDFCDECISSCSRCEGAFCRGCMEKCPVCSDLACQACMTSCPDCDRCLCLNCLEDNQCPCIEENEENENDHDKNATTRADAASDPAEEDASRTDVIGQAARATVSSVGVNPA